MSAALDDMSVVQYKDLIGVADGFQTVGNHDDGLVMGQCLDSPLQFILILRVNAACCLVQNDDPKTVPGIHTGIFRATLRLFHLYNRIRRQASGVVISNTF